MKNHTSVFPSVILLWNNLDMSFKEKPTLSSFKLSLKDKVKRKEILYYGQRWPSIHHSRMRLGCSLLKAHLFNNLHVIDNEACACGHISESVSHFLLSCPLFVLQRAAMIRSVSRVSACTVDILLNGNSTLSLEENKIIFDAVHNYIIQTERF